MEKNRKIGKMLLPSMLVLFTSSFLASINETDAGMYNCMALISFIIAVSFQIVISWGEILFEILLYGTIRLMLAGLLLSLAGYFIGEIVGNPIAFSLLMGSFFLVTFSFIELLREEYGFWEITKTEYSETVTD